MELSVLIENESVESAELVVGNVAKFDQRVQRKLSRGS